MKRTEPNAIPDRLEASDQSGPIIDTDSEAGIHRPATLVQGLRSSLPLVIGYLPIAFSFGVAASNHGFSTLESVLLSAVIYSGASQFVALPLLAAGTGALVIIVTLLTMNLRHLLYGPALLDRAGPEPRTRYAWAWAFGLTDEVFATSIGFLSENPRGWGEGWMTGMVLATYLSWVLGTIAGAVAGGGALANFPALEAALGFMLPALFLALLLAVLTRRELPVVTTAGTVCAAVSLTLGATSGILAGMLAGALVGVMRPLPVEGEGTG